MSLVIVRPDGSLEVNILIPPGQGSEQLSARAERGGVPMTDQGLGALFAQGWRYGILPWSAYQYAYRGEVGFSDAIAAWQRAGIPRYVPGQSTEPPNTNGGPPGFQGSPVPHQGAQTYGEAGARQYNQVFQGSTGGDAPAGAQLARTDGAELGMFDVSMGWADLVDLIGEALPALIDLPRMPEVVLGEPDKNFDNVLKYLEADAKYAQNDERIRAVADAVRMAMQANGIRRISIKDLIKLAAEAVVTLSALPVRPQVVTSDEDANFRNIFLYVQALGKHSHRDEQIRAGATGIGVVINRWKKGA